MKSKNTRNVAFNLTINDTYFTYDMKTFLLLTKTIIDK